MKLHTRLFVTVITLASPLLAGQDADSTPVVRPVVAWTILKQGLIDRGTDHRRQAILAAGSIGATPESLRFIEEGLHDKETIVRQTAATVLGLRSLPKSAM